MQYREIDERASDLGRHLTIFQMSASHGVPALVLASQVKIIERIAKDLGQMLNEHPDAEVTIDTRLNEGMETAYREVFGTPTDVPDYPPEDLGGPSKSD